MLWPELRYGQSNKAVRALQNGLHRALAAKKLPHRNLRNGGFGALTQKDLLRFRRAYMTPSGPINGKAVGSDVWTALGPFLGEYDLSLIRQHNRAVAAARAELRARRLAAKAANSAEARRARLRAVGLRFYAERANYVYRQVRPMPGCLFCPAAYNRLDCSSSFTEIYREAGEPDPNGRGYDGFGYTGTLIVRGRWRQGPAMAGDAVHYGDQGGGVSSHVLMALDASVGVSFGSNPVRLAALGYRRDLRGWKDHITA